MKMLICTIAAVALLTGCSKPAAQTGPWFEAESQIQRELTNDVVGYARTININVLRPTADPLSWTAHVELEFVNTTGGIGRTNLPYLCIGTNIWTLDRENLLNIALENARLPR